MPEDKSILIKYRNLSVPLQIMVILGWVVIAYVAIAFTIGFFYGVLGA